MCNNWQLLEKQGQACRVKSRLKQNLYWVYWYLLANLGKGVLVYEVNKRITTIIVLRHKYKNEGHCFCGPTCIS